MFSLFTEFFKIGCVSIGGGYAMLPIIYQTVDTYDIMTKTEFSNLVAISQITPGPVSINTATYAGFEAYGWTGAVLISLAVCLPCALFSYLTLSILNRNASAQGMSIVLSKMKIAGVALVGASGLFLAEGSIFTEVMLSLDCFKYIDPIQLCIFVATLILFVKKLLGPVGLTLLMGGISIAVNYGIAFMQQIR